MLSISNVDVIERLKFFKNLDIDVTFLVPTKTGLEKSIMDATKNVRDYLKDNNIHNFSSQQQGLDNKIIVDTTYYDGEKFLDTKTSLYRPETKSGDPRIWIYNLSKYSDSGDLLALIAGQNNKLFIINCSRTDLDSFFKKNNLLINNYIKNSIETLSPIASELLDKIKRISEEGFIKTLRVGDTGVGFTLETKLDIKANANQSPDYKGIELKSFRKKKNRSGRTTMKSQVPNWDLSNLKSSKEILFKRGKFNELKKRHQLFHEHSTIKTNSYSMKLLLDDSKNYLYQIFINAENQIEKDVVWDLNLLISKLKKKHKETFWVSATTMGKSGDENESFKYENIKHTGYFSEKNFLTLIETGRITLDYTIKEKPNGGVKDQGYLFKIHSKDLELLFTFVKNYSLT